MLKRNIARTHGEGKTRRIWIKKIEWFKNLVELKTLSQFPVLLEKKENLKTCSGFLSLSHDLIKEVSKVEKR